MDFAALKAAIKTAVVAALGSDETTVYWKGTTAANTWRDGVSPNRVELRLTRVQASGVDERRVYTDADDVVQEEFCGNRELTVSVRIESESQEDGEDAVGQLAANLRARLRRPEVLAGLHAAGLGLAVTHPTVTADYVDQNRDMSVSVTDLLFTAAESDKREFTGDTIESVKFTLEPDLLPRERTVPEA